MANVVMTAIKNLDDLDVVHKSAEFAEIFSGKLEVVHMREEDVRYNGEEMMITEKDPDQSEALMSKVSSVLDAEYDIEFECSIINNSEHSPSDFASYAEETSADFIFVGHKTGRFAEDYIGSFAKDLMDHASTDIIVVPGLSGETMDS